MIEEYLKKKIEYLKIREGHYLDIYNDDNQSLINKRFAHNFLNTYRTRRHELEALQVFLNLEKSEQLAKLSSLITDTPCYDECVSSSEDGTKPKEL